jgi:hypothetical protein
MLGSPPAVLRAHGALGAYFRRDIRRHVLEEIVLPCARALAETSFALQPTSRRDESSAPGVFPVSARNSAMRCA